MVTQVIQTDSKLHNICCIVYKSDERLDFPLVLLDFQGSLFLRLQDFKSLLYQKQQLSDFDKINLQLWMDLYNHTQSYSVTVQGEQFLKIDFCIWLLRKLYISDTHYNVCLRLLKQLSATYESKKAFLFLTQESPIVVLCV